MGTAAKMLSDRPMPNASTRASSVVEAAPTCVTASAKAAIAVNSVAVARNAVSKKQQENDQKVTLRLH